MTYQEAVQVLGRAHAGCYTADSPFGRRVTAAHEFLRDRGHTVTVRSRPGVVDTLPSARVYIDGKRVA